MLLLLFYVEELRGAIVGAIQATDHWLRRTNHRIKPETKNKFKRATDALVSDGILSRREATEIAALADIRNVIAHELQKMTFDVSRDTWVKQVQAVEKARYDHQALDRLKYFQGELERRMRSKYVHQLSSNTLLFKSAERTYNSEIKVLKKKINAQYEMRQRKIARLRYDLSLKGSQFEKEELHPAHPGNIGRNGALTRRGVEICFRLFDLGKSATVVAYLMYISVKAARRRYNQWLKLGGIERQRIEL